MGECGCVSNDEHYKFPGPGESFYILTLSGVCTSCHSPAGVSIEMIKPGTFMHEYYQNRDYFNGDLKFEKWPDSEGIAIVTGLTQEEFVKATQHHLVGIDSKLFGEDGKIDADGSEVILEEMYEDTAIGPMLLEQEKT